MITHFNNESMLYKLITFALLCISFNALSFDNNGPLKSKNRVDKAVVIARTALADARSNTKLAPKWRNAILRVQKAFKTLTISWAPAGEDFQFCIDSPKKLAFTEPGKGHAYLCNLIFAGSDQKMAQTIIHETIHTIGIQDECETSRIEKIIMTNSRYGLIYKNGYWNQCGL